MKRHTFFSFLLFTCTLILSACTCGSNNKDTGGEAQPVDVSISLFHNRDSLLFYAKKAYLEEDPRGLYVTGAAAYLRATDENFPDSCTTISLSEARIMLLRAAELGNEDAQKLIECLKAGDCWPED